MALAWKAGWVNALRGSNPLSSASASSGWQKVVAGRPFSAILTEDAVPGARGSNSHCRTPKPASDSQRKVAS